MWVSVTSVRPRKPTSWGKSYFLVGLVKFLRTPEVLKIGMNTGNILLIFFYIFPPQYSYFQYCIIIQVLAFIFLDIGRTLAM